MSSVGSAEPFTPHTRSTRLVHAGLALSVCLQLGTSLLMQGPSDTDPGDLLFQIHRYSGFVALGFALLFWCILAIRQRGTELAALFPWLSPRRVSAVFTDLGNQIRSLLGGRLPEHHDDSALASAIHGLGILLMSAMALSGTLYAVQVWIGQISAEPEGSTAMTVHFALANLVWAYLIGHGAMAAIHHFARSAPLSRMWKLAR